jgi:carbon storage regulator
VLVLTRKLNEGIMIGSDIEIRITRIQGDSVRIAITAPRDLEILRKEIFDEVIRQNHEAALTADVGILEQIIKPTDIVDQQAPKPNAVRLTKLSKSDLKP